MHPRLFLPPFALPFLLLVLLLPLGAAQARLLTGTVTHVTDGDSVWVRGRSGAPLEVRIAGIDAPEGCQAWGPQARQALQGLLQGHQVTVRTRRRDDYGRTLATLQVQGHDVGAWMVGRGHAWSYRFRRDQGPYVDEEQAARSARRGLWAQGAPVEPRRFRRLHGPCERH